MSDYGVPQTHYVLLPFRYVLDHIMESIVMRLIMKAKFLQCFSIYIYLGTCHIFLPTAISANPL